MRQMPIPFRLKGRIPDDDYLHQVAAFDSAALVRPPRWVHVPEVGRVPQYAPVVFGKNLRYHPASDCRGYFTASKFQTHNNCYNYALDIATNTMAQPGRKHGLVINGDTNGGEVLRGALKDGLILVGKGDTKIAHLRRQASHLRDGHFVALLISLPNKSVGFPGDFHWVRCDDLQSLSWSNKDGPGQVTALDFAGRPVVDPSKANWKLNSGPIAPNKQGSPDLYLTYRFRAWMFVPRKGVDII